MRPFLKVQQSQRVKKKGQAKASTANAHTDEQGSAIARYNRPLTLAERDFLEEFFSKHGEEFFNTLEPNPYSTNRVIITGEKFVELLLVILVGKEPELELDALCTNPALYRKSINYRISNGGFYKVHNDYPSKYASRVEYVFFKQEMQSLLDFLELAFADLEAGSL